MSARWFSEYPERSEISKEEYDLRCKIVKIMEKYVDEMEQYSYYGSNPGIPEGDLEDLADELLTTFKISE